MDTKRTVISVAFAMAFIASWILLLNYVNSKWPVQNAASPAATTQPVTAAAAGTQPSAIATTGPAPSSPVATGLQVLDSAPGVQASTTLGSAVRKDPTYALQLVTSPIGAGVESVVLNDFLASVDDPE